MALHGNCTPNPLLGCHLPHHAGVQAWSRQVVSFGLYKESQANPLSCKLFPWFQLEHRPLFFLCSLTAMVVLANPALDEIPLVRPQKHGAFFSAIPVVDLSRPFSAEALVKACEDVGFVKVINHNVPMDVVQRLEAETVKFFEMPQVFKETSGPADPFGYGNKRIGPNGDVGLVEYLLFGITSKPLSYTSMSFLEEPSACLFG